MIRKALESERQRVFDIWKTCFGDEDAYIDYFMGQLYRPERCLLYIADDIPAAMLHLLPIDYRVGQERIPGQYIYAAATLPQYRRQGIMAELVEYASMSGKNTGKRFTSLMPANENLYGYYETCGFHAFYPIKRVSKSRAEMTETAAGGRKIKSIQPDIGKIFRQRQAYFKNAVLWDAELLQYIMNEWQFTGGRIFAWDTGYCFYRAHGNEMMIKEACASPEEYSNLLASLLKLSDAQRFIIDFDIEAHISGEKTRYGMIKYEDKKLNPDTFQNAYFNMVLDW